MCPIKNSSDFHADGWNIEVLWLGLHLIITAWVSKQVRRLQHPCWKEAKRAAGWLDGWKMEGWMDGWMAERWMDGWMDVWLPLKGSCCAEISDIEVVYPDSHRGASLWLSDVKNVPVQAQCTWFYGRQIFFNCSWFFFFFFKSLRSLLVHKRPGNKRSCCGSGLQCGSSGRVGQGIRSVCSDFI